MNKLPSCEVLHFTARDSPNLCVCWGRGGHIAMNLAKEEDGSVDQDPPRTIVSSISHCWKVQRDLWPYKLSWGLLSIPSDYFIYQTFKYHIKILYPEGVKFPKETSHTLRILFMEMKVFESNKKLELSFLWLCPPCTQLHRSNSSPHIPFLPRYLASSPACRNPPSALHCLSPRKFSLTPGRHLLGFRVEASHVFQKRFYLIFLGTGDDP